MDRENEGVRGQRTRRTAPLGTAAIAAVVGIVWAGGSLESLTSQEESQPADQPNDPVQRAIDPHGDWVLVESAGLRDAHSLGGLIEVDGRIVAVGQGATPVVTSTDAMAWAPADTPEAALWGVIPGGPGLIAYGDSEWRGEADDHQAVLWTSPDGLDWTSPQQLTSARGTLRTVRQIGPQLIASGLIDDSSHPDFAGYHGWTSIDGGTTWSRATSDPESLGVDVAPHERVDHIIAAGPGFVAIGSDGLDGAVWTSADGESWTQLPDGPQDLDGEINRVLSTGGDLVAVGNTFGIDPTFDARVWTSVDGITWQRVIDESFHGSDGQEIDDLSGERISDVIETEIGLVAVGVTGLDQTAVANWSGAVWVVERP
jgi:hypothetical protein